MRMNERVAHLEATVCQLVDNLHELETQFAAVRNERVAHLEATVCQLVDNLHRLDTKFAAVTAEEVIPHLLQMGCSDPECWCHTGPERCPSKIFGYQCEMPARHWPGQAHTTHVVNTDTLSQIWWESKP